MFYKLTCKIIRIIKFPFCRVYIHKLTLRFLLTFTKGNFDRQNEKVPAKSAILKRFEREIFKKDILSGRDIVVQS